MLPRENPGASGVHPPPPHGGAPPEPAPRSFSPRIPLARVREAVSKAHRDLLASGENVSAWGINSLALIELEAESFNALGFRIPQIQSLNRLMLLEAKVNTFIHCFLRVWKITSLHDLNVAICKSEGIHRFDELELGPLLRHPLVIYYFLVPSDTEEIVNITSTEIISYLLEFLDQHIHVTTDAFLDFIAIKRAEPVKEKLGIRIQSLKMYAHFIRDAKEIEASTVANYLSSKMSEGLGKCVCQHKYFLRKQFRNILMSGNSFSPIHKDSVGKHTRSDSFSLEDEVEHTEIDDKDVKDDSALRSSTKNCSQNRNISDQSVSSCVYPSASKVEMAGQSSPAINRVICEENKRVSATKRKCESQTIDKSFKLPKRDRADSSGHDLELLEDHDGGKSQCIKSKSTPGWGDRNAYVEFSKEAMNDSITTWKDECRLLPGSQVESIKNGMGDGFYDTFQVSGEPGHITSTSAPIEPESISVEPSCERDALFKKEYSSQLNPSVNIDDICKKVSTYFDLSQTIPVEGKSIWEKQLTFLKKLHDCQQWLTKQFGVKEFGNLGCGEFHIFLEKHPSLFPNELVERLFVDESKKSTFEVSVCPHQLVMLLSQAESCLRRNEALTKVHMYKLLSKQFPVISLQVTSSGPIEDVSEFLRKHKNAANSNSVLYSVTLLGTDYVNHSVIQTNMSENTGINPDFVFTAGALGSVSAKDAVECLLKAPMLIDLQSWSHWDLIFAPTLGPLVEWLVNGVYMKELLCLVTKDGKIIRLDNSATVDEFLEAILKGSAREAAVKLLSLFSLYGGEGNVPLSILKFHSQRGIENILIISMESATLKNSSNFYLPDGKSLKGQNAQETTAKQPLLNLLGKNLANLDLQDQNRINKAVPVASRFILDCLCYLPSEFRSFAADVLLSGLQSFIKDAPSTILRECSQTDHRLMLHSIGLSLNICEWITDYHAFSSGASNDLSLSIAAANPQVSSPVHGFLKVKRDALDDLSVSDDKMVIDKETDKYPVVIAEVCDCKVNDVSTEKSGDGTRSNLPKSNRNHDGTLIVESIRREEFGLVSSQTEADNIMLKKQHARLGRALQCLSQELYSQDSHFLLELVQNADDNVYSKTVEPTLVFILQSTGIVVLNNEQGFTAENIRALCDVGNSTKKGSIAGYIGQKGIGFKSVFRVTDAPEIHSNGFNVKFDITEGQIGFVLPTVVPSCDTSLLSRLLPDEADKTDACWNTCIVLPFKSKLREGMGLSSIVSLFSDLQPSLLLFLHRLQCIKFKNLLNDTYTVMKRENLEDGIVKVSHGEEIMSWFVASQNLQANSLRPDVQTTKISMAFTLKEFSDGEYSPHLEQQPVYAFLPLRTYGLKFILQGDFVLPSSREEVDADSAWNQWLLSKFPDLFVSAQKSFCDLRCFQERPGRAVAAYMSFVPLVGEVHGCFSQLPRMIISKLRMSNCLLVDGKEVWAPPCRVLRGWNEQARIILPDDLLHQHLGLSYLDKDISLSDSLAKALGVSEYGPRILIEIISAVCSCEEGIKSICFDWLSSWLSSLFMMFAHSSGHPSVNALVESDLIGMLKRIPLIPLSDGKYGSIAEGTIWLTSDAVNCGFEGQYESEVFAKLYANLRLVSPAFLFAAAENSRGIHDLTVDNVIKMLFKIGVQRLVSHELIKVHILPALSDNRIAERDVNLMVEYLSFVMLHLQSTCPSCQTEREIFISELQTKTFILTNHGFKRAAEVPVHFSRAFGNPVDMTKLIDIMDSDWHEVDSIYLKHSSNKSLSFGLMKWRDFFQGLGVTDFVQTVLIEKDIADMSHTLFNDIMHNRDLIVSGLVVKDWESPELVHLLSTLSSQNNREKSKYLLEVLDKMWDDCFCAKARGCITTKSGEDVKQFKSSFIESINDIQWMPSSIDQKLHCPKDLFCDCKEVRSILGNFAPYSLPLGRSRFIFGDIGLKTHITIEDALETLQVMRNFKAPVAASIDQMSKLYAIICNQMGTAKAEIARGFSSRPSIFLPTKDFRHEDVISGKLFSSEEVFWHDPTGLLDLTKEILIQCNSLSETYYSINKTLANVYPGFHDFFVNECKVCETPPPRSYIQILVQLSEVTLPSQSANAVLCVLLKWANDLKSGLLESEDATYLKECLLTLETTILPTEQNKWVSLHPTFGLVCWCDKEELWKEFEHCDNIAFLYFGEISHDEKQVLSAKISGVMQALGVPSLSELITREAIFWGTNDCTEKALLVAWVLPYAQRYIYKMHPDKYIQLYQSGFENICNLQIVVVQKLFYRHTVKGCSSASNKQTECSCLLQKNTLYVDRASNSHPIFLELSRLFFNGTPELHLANFLHLIRVMAESGSTEEQIELFLVNNQKIPKLPDEEPVWFLSYLLSRHVDDGNIQPSSVSAAMEEQNMSKFKTKPDFSTNWPPSWRAAIDSNVAQENQLWKERTVPPPTVSLQKTRKTKNNPCKKGHEVPVGTGVDWIIESTSIESTTDIVQDLGARLGKPLHGSSSLISRRTSSSSAGLNQAFGTNGHLTAITGRTGELVASKYFAKKVTGATVKWVNEETETGLPYDIVIGDSEESKEYIEVKATNSVKKDWFAISTGEWQFAVDKGESFSIAHVSLEGPSNAKVTVFKNPAKLCRQGTLHLAVLMPKIQENM